MNKSNPLAGGQKLIVIVGPTASGKSDLGIKIAKKFGGEIISADSRQVYRGMDIGTGKVTKKEQKMARHHLIDIASPKKQFTASDFNKLGQEALIDIASRSKIPIIVGGTGFYIDILLGRMTMAQVPPNLKLRKRFDKLSTKHLFKMLRKLDPQRAKAIDPYNKRRLIRALEIILTTKKPSPVIKYPLSNNDYEILWLGVNPGKEKLAKNIKSRLEKRLDRGMAREVKDIHKQGISHKRLQKFGLEYKWISLYLQNKISYEEMKENLYRDIIRYSKRQMTWFKRNKEIHWLNPQASEKNEAERVVSTFLRKTTR
ncbi:MAG: tRNA (adenosine(37)-N6)-dimethylallyltransferase MiaA [bacterium]|nr:tRNA (adenosine(37)-N6)-dimethylallyltransferase MiaA [bacterium]